MRKTLMLVAGCALALIAGQSLASGPTDYLMDEAEELRLASTAGPKAVTEGATYWVLRRTGYEKVRDGDNGFHCFLERSWGAPTPDNSITFDPRIRAPHCINPEGARTTMQERFFIARMAMAGKGSDEINAAVDKALASGELELPKELALTYMMSAYQWLGEGQSAWKPHVMLWMPNVERAEVGPLPTGMLVGKPGSHRSCLVFVMPEFIR